LKVVCGFQTQAGDRTIVKKKGGINKRKIKRRPERISDPKEKNKKKKKEEGEEELFLPTGFIVLKFGGKEETRRWEKRGGVSRL